MEPTCRLCGSFKVHGVDISLHQDQLSDARGFIAISLNERVRLDSIEKENEELRKEIGELRNTLKDDQMIKLDNINKDMIIKQLEMIIDILNQKIRHFEGKLNRMSKKLYTLTKEDYIDTDNSDSNTNKLKIFL